MTLAAPRNTTELREIQAWALQNGDGWTVPGARIWIDAEFSLHEQAFLNVLTKERLDLIYPGVDSKQHAGDPWTHRLDDHWVHPALILQSGALDFAFVPDITPYMNGNSRSWIPEGQGAAPTGHVVCQRASRPFHTNNLGNVFWLRSQCCVQSKRYLGCVLRLWHKQL